VDQNLTPGCSHLNKKGQLTIVGSLGGLSIGDTIQVTGTVLKHPVFGDQLQVTGYKVTQSTCLAGLIAYMANCIDLIGPVLGKRIVNHFGVHTLEVMDQEPHRLKEVAGIGELRAESIIKEWPNTRALRQIHQFLSGIGVNPGLAEKFLKKYGQDAVAQISKDPYCLARDVDGYGFLKADEIAKKLGIQEMSPVRLRAAIFHVMTDLTTKMGDCFQYRTELLNATAAMLNNPSITADLVDSVLLETITCGFVAAEDNRVYLPKVKEAEDAVIDRLSRLMSHPFPSSLSNTQAMFDHAKATSTVPLDDVQGSAVWQGLSSKVSIITGGPGTGKSSITRALVAGYDHAHIPVLLMAPTGKAAKRMNEIIGREAFTIHRYLFQRVMNSGDPVIRNCVIIIDEMSMVDVALFAWLLSFCEPNVVLVIVGDADQLPSVGPGAVLRDLLLCPAIPSTRLTTIYRQAQGSDIIINAHRINEGQAPKLMLFGKRYGMPTTDMYAVVNEEPEFLANAAVYCATQFAQYKGFNPVTEVQLLAPMHKGVLGVQNLNVLLQRAINPSPADMFFRDKEHTVRWGVGDKLMQTVNNYDLDLINGDTGIIHEICWAEGRKHVKQMVLKVDDRMVEVPGNKFNDLILAYACTIHKFQGSQVPMLVMCLHTCHFTMLQRNLLYTGVTRAEKVAVLCCSERAVDMAVKNKRIANRNTWLKEKLDLQCQVGVSDAC
jgi:exodeoxyribonuclease V alpha subunit